MTGFRDLAEDDSKITYIVIYIMVNIAALNLK